MHWIKANIESDSEAHDLLVTTFRHLVATVAALYLCWHFVATLTWPELFSPSLWRVSILISALTVGTIYLISRQYLLAHLFWHLGLSGSIVLAYSLYARPEIALLLPSTMISG